MVFSDICNGLPKHFFAKVIFSQKKDRNAFLTASDTNFSAPQIKLCQNVWHCETFCNFGTDLARATSRHTEKEALCLSHSREHTLCLTRENHSSIGMGVIKAMKSKVFIAICLLIGICLNSCNNKPKIVWNDKVQDTFFGMTLGDPVDADFVIKNMRSKGFCFNYTYSTNTLLHFRNRDSEYFSFGGLSWAMLDISIDNGILTGIRFMNSSTDKASALSDYNDIKDALEAKYSATPVTPKDTTIYAQTTFCGRNNTYASVSCYRYESVSKHILICTQILYETDKGKEKVNEEL